MHIELLAKQMREAAIDKMTAYERWQLDLKAMQARELTKMQKLYFNAGRWAGGARDKIAKECFEKVLNGK
jgi:hypothetical protein